MSLSRLRHRSILRRRAEAHSVHPFDTTANLTSEDFTFSTCNACRKFWRRGNAQSSSSRAALFVSAIARAQSGAHRDLQAGSAGRRMNSWRTITLSGITGPREHTLPPAVAPSHAYTDDNDLMEASFGHGRQKVPSRISLGSCPIIVIFINVLHGTCCLFI